MLELLSKYKWCLYSLGIVCCYIISIPYQDWQIEKFQTKKLTYDIQTPSERHENRYHGNKVSTGFDLGTSQEIELSDGPPLILIWNQRMGQRSGKLKETDKLVVPEICGGCEVTSNRSRIKNSDAVIIFNDKYTFMKSDLPDPLTRNAHQFYVFWTKETPSKTFAFHEVLKRPEVDGIFNLTWYFRSDSDIQHKFGSFDRALFYSNKYEKTKNFTKLMESRKRLAFWAVSNCDQTYGATMRMNYGMQLIKNGLDVTTLGKCFNNSAPQKRRRIFEDFENFKFYLAFENSIHCPDYVTEKFWKNGIETGAVPIVFGPTKADVEAIAPPNSFIHTEDFSSQRDLVNFINFLDKNDTAYLHYHQWRKMPKISNVNEAYIELRPDKRGLCILCKKLLERPIKRKSIPSIHDWLYKSKKYVDDFCLYGKKKSKTGKQNIFH